jgi:hypothetical protein
MFFWFPHLKNVTAKCLLGRIARRREMYQHKENSNNCQRYRAPPAVEKCSVDLSPRSRLQRSCQHETHYKANGQSANVGGIVDTGMGKSVDQVKGDECNPAQSLSKEFGR